MPTAAASPSIQRTSPVHRARSGQREHRRRRLDADHPEAVLGELAGDQPGAAAQIDDGHRAEFLGERAGSEARLRIGLVRVHRVVGGDEPRIGELDQHGQVSLRNPTFWSALHTEPWSADQNRCICTDDQGRARGCATGRAATARLAHRQRVEGRHRTPRGRAGCLWAVGDGCAGRRRAPDPGRAPSRSSCPRSPATPRCRRRTQSREQSLGFDTCDTPGLAEMWVWRQHSPYSTVAVYIGGELRHCKNPFLDDGVWVPRVVEQGWRIIPIYVGPQAPCTNFRLTIDAENPESHGRGDGPRRRGLRVVGLPPGAPIYYDLEAYRGADLACSDVVNTFVSGWVREVRAAGYKTGLYTTPRAARRAGAA